MLSIHSWASPTVSDKHKPSNDYLRKPEPLTCANTSKNVFVNLNFVLSSGFIRGSKHIITSSKQSVGK